MRIDVYCVDNPCDPSTWSGTPYYFVQALERRGIIVKGYKTKKDKNTYINLLNQLRYARIDWNYKRIKTLYMHSRPFLLENYNQLLSIYRKHDKPDAVIMIGDIGILQGVPYYLLQDMDIDTIIRWKTKGKRTYVFDYFPLGFLKRRRQWQCKVYSKASGIFVATKWVGRSVKASGAVNPKRVHGVGLGANFDAQTFLDLKNKNLKEKTILFIGRDFKRKGLDILLDAFSILKKEIRDLKLIVAGANVKINMKDVEVIRSADKKTLDKLFRSASIFVMPSRFEGFGIVYVEALSYQLPVVAGDCCGIREIIKEGYNGYLTNYQADDCALKIKMVLSDESRYRELSKNALESSKSLTWDKVAEKVVKQIEKDLKQDIDGINRTGR